MKGISLTIIGFVISIILIILLSLHLFGYMELGEVPYIREKVVPAIKKIMAPKGKGIINATTTTTLQPTQQMIPTTTTQPSQKFEIFIYADHYEPPEVTIRMGDTVEWINKDTKEHILVLPSLPLEKRIIPTGSFSFMFYRTGTFEFWDGDNQDMRGRIIVTE